VTLESCVHVTGRAGDEDVEVLSHGEHCTIKMSISDEIDGFTSSSGLATDFTDLLYSRLRLRHSLAAGASWAR
jgi:hypothetical protein